MNKRPNAAWMELFRSSKKTLILALSLVLMLTSAVSGTIAWLTAQTDSIKNTFTYGAIKIDLTETDDGDDDVNNNSYTMEPNATIAKDPVVTVKSGSKASWVFIQIDESANFDDYLTYEVDNNWKHLTDIGEDSHVYYCAVDQAQADIQIPVLKNNQVQVKNVSEDALMQLDASGMHPTLTFTAYAVQSEGLSDVNTAWMTLQTELIG